MRALIVSSDVSVHGLMVTVLEDRGCVVDNARSTEKAMYFIKTRIYDVIVLPDKCDGRFDIAEVAQVLQRLHPAKNAQIILIESSRKLSTRLNRTLGNKTILKIPRLGLEDYPFDEVFKPKEDK